MPPIQWVRRTISDASSSISATTSWMTVRTIRFLSLASVGGADQTALRSAASAATCPGERDGSDVEASCAAILVSISPTRVSALFHRNSSSAAISNRGHCVASFREGRDKAGATLLPRSCDRMEEERERGYDGGGKRDRARFE